MLTYLHLHFGHLKGAQSNISKDFSGTRGSSPESELSGLALQVLLSNLVGVKILFKIFVSKNIFKANKEERYCDSVTNNH